MRENSYIGLPLDKVTEWMTVNKWKLYVWTAVEET